ncbi:MAG TPA: Pycsar system effector family protein [Polyangiaceae bacterium]|nr:Pycsar system effector family protein [Polyangiaceae bacterium]
MNSCDFASKTNEYITSYIAAADTKAGALLTFVTILGTAVGFAAPTVLRSAHSAACIVYVIEWTIAAVVLVSVGGTLLHCLKALSPSTPSAGASLHSFPDLATMSPDEVVARVEMLTPADAAKNLSLHNVTLARIAQDKFRQLGLATRWLGVALAATLCMTYAFALIAVIAGEAGK